MSRTARRKDFKRDVRSFVVPRSAPPSISRKQTAFHITTSKKSISRPDRGISRKPSAFYITSDEVALYHDGIAVHITPHSGTSRSLREHITHRQVHITFASRTYHDGTAVHITPRSGISRRFSDITHLPQIKKQGLTEALSRTLPLPLLFFSLIDTYCECRQTAKISKIIQLTTHQQTSWTFS